MISFHGIRHVLLDIEGTTCPVNFVNEVLFPYASAQMLSFLRAHQSEEPIQKILGEVQSAMAHGSAQQMGTGREFTANWQDQPEPCLDTIASYLEGLIQTDQKMTALKDLQGMIWEEGYQRGDLVAPLFPDVADALHRWHADGIQLSVYSSGSIQAQKLLYANTAWGDLSHLFDHWFDTHTGPKSDPSSYIEIVRVLRVRAEDLLFISDSIAELNAAQQAEIPTLFSLRPGNPQQDSGSHAIITDYKELHF